MALNPGRPAHTRPRLGYERELSQERAMRTRERILAGAAEAFANRSYAEVRMVQIAKLIKMTKGAIYFHFKNKEALALALADAFEHRMAANADAVAALGLPPLDSLAEFLHRIAGDFRDDVLMKAGARLQTERLPAPFVTFDAVVESLLDKADAAGQLPAGISAGVLSRVVVEAVFGAQHISWVHSDRADIVERMDELVRVLLRTEPRPHGVPTEPEPPRQTQPY